MIDKIIISVLIVVLNLNISLLFFKGTMKRLFGIIGLMSLLAAIAVNTIYKTKNNFVILIILMFSVAIIVALLFNKLNKMRLKNNANYKEMDNKVVKKFLQVKTIFLSFIFPVLITVYQLLLIGSDKLSNEIMNSNESNESVHVVE